MNANKEKAIVFSTEMVKAILKGRKSQTRRVIKPQPVWTNPPWKENPGPAWVYKGTCWYKKENMTDMAVEHYAPYKVGDILWVREIFTSTREGNYIYKADPIFNDCGPGDISWDWKPPIHMPREAARLFLKVKSVRVERLQDISEEDARAEGVGKQFLEQWVKENDKYIDDAYWIYYDDLCRYWCSKHIDQAVRTFRKEVKNGEKEIANLDEEINCMTGGAEEEEPINCETCGKSLHTALIQIPYDLDDLIEGRLTKYEAALFDVLLNDYEKELFERENIHRLLFSGLWNNINEKRGFSWESNPWVWVYEFVREGK
jgi:hypothetical protein